MPMNRGRAYRRHQSERIKLRNIRRAVGILGTNDVIWNMCSADVRSGCRFFFAGDTVRNDKMWQLIWDYKFQRSLPV